WDERKKALRTALMRGDAEFVRETARLFPEASTDFLEQELLVEWAHGVIDSMADRAAAALHGARALAETLAEVTHDALPRDGIAVVDAATRDRASSSVRDLAGAHLAYAQGLDAYDADDYPRAQASWNDAFDRFRRTGSPYREWANARIEMVLF